MRGRFGKKRKKIFWKMLDIINQVWYIIDTGRCRDRR